ncbi:MAG: 16S rRNA (uracil(1498)-N(3))-methyltransferase [Nitrospirae bacterium]|nr:16S rRNA (uracil(1498)-N(3))-methyltransferase [Nitrospirota bacterium]
MRIILSKNEIHDDRITISGENARYLTSVLRCRVGDEVQIFDGEGGLYKAEIVEVDNKQIFADIIERSLINTESPLNLVLIQGILKGEKMDWVIQKTTELGVKEIIPVITERSQVRYTRKVERWKKIAEEASRQSGRSIIPVVHEPVNFCDIFSQSLSGFIFWEDGGVRMQDTRYKIQDNCRLIGETHTPCRNSSSLGGDSCTVFIG